MLSQMDNDGRAYHHTEACQMLGVSVATMRRLAKHYEDAFEALPTDAKGGRIYPNHALKRIQAARVLFDEGRAANLETAFKLLARGGGGAEGEVLLHASEPEPLQQLLIEFRGMRQAMELLLQENAEIKEQLKVLTPPSDTPSTVVDDERSKEIEELHKRIGYLQGELERRSPSRDEQEEQRRWWRIWKR